ncbi:uncharacterized protein isoform X2 [Takifugu rubripes]|uniref:uncharacterized protein isoform X2 n=1 Tax=Takifugu rubripes TaxID=31033 RepID=UPI001145FC5B|nr:uncharacterized protein LOC115247029 isoform X2 [Takifugu rubripes]
MFLQKLQQQQMALSLRETGETQLFEDQFLLNEEAKFFKNQTELLQQEKERLPLLDDEALAATVSLNSDLKTSVDINAMQQEQNEALQNEIEDLLREREQFKQFLMIMIAGWETRLSILDFCDENEVRENLEVFVATDKTQFNNLIYRQWIQSLRTWNGEPETLQRHLTLWQSTFTFRGKEKNFLKSWFKKTFKLKAKKAAVSQSSQQCRHHGEIQEEPKPSFWRRILHAVCPCLMSREKEESDISFSDDTHNDRLMSKRRRPKSAGAKPLQASSPSSPDS